MIDTFSASVALPFLKLPNVLLLSTSMPEEIYTCLYLRQTGTGRQACLHEGQDFNALIKRLQ
jgi:hypothetical protein